MNDATTMKIKFTLKQYRNREFEKTIIIMTTNELRMRSKTFDHVY
jgi:hypothetical protein